MVDVSSLAAAIEPQLCVARLADIAPATTAPASGLPQNIIASVAAALTPRRSVPPPDRTK